MRTGLAAFIAVLAVAIPETAPAERPPLRAEVVGHSVQDRPIRLVRVGDPAAPRTVLVVGCIHGTERAGLAVTRALRRVEPPAGVQLLLLDAANPDGCVRGTRGNARGVDLNRNFPRAWRPLRGVFASGPRPSSEPETRAAQRLILRERPSVTVWYHQALNWVDLQPGSNRRLMRLYARTAGMRATRTPLLPGTVARWQNHRLPGRTAFVVELPAGRLAPAAVFAHRRAVLALAAEVAPRSGERAGSPRSSAGTRGVVARRLAGERKPANLHP
jgi:protein MpaA